MHEKSAYVHWFSDQLTTSWAENKNKRIAHNRNKEFNVNWRDDLYSEILNTNKHPTPPFLSPSRTKKSRPNLSNQTLTTTKLGEIEEIERGGVNASHATAWTVMYIQMSVSCAGILLCNLVSHYYHFHFLRMLQCFISLSLCFAIRNDNAVMHLVYL